MEIVEKGIAYLDENEPGWLIKINIETLDMHNPRQCILGQITGRNYRHYLEEHMYDDEAVDLGLYMHYSLDANGHIDDDATDLAYAQLTQDWRIAIEQKRKM